MKKGLLLLATLLAFLHCEAQEIVANGVPFDKNVVLYATSGINIFSGKEKNSGLYSEVCIGLSCEYNTKTKAKTWVVDLSLTTDGKSTIREGMQMLVKCTNGTIVTLKNKVEHYPKYWASRDLYYTAANYTTTTQQFNLLKSKQFSKIRIVTLIKKLDYELKEDDFCSAIKKCYDIIQKEISNKTAGVYDGF